MVVETLDRRSFDDFIKGREPTIVDFWASWCKSCETMAPVFEELSRNLEGRLRFGKISTEEAPGVAARHDIRNIPCFVIFDEGKEIGRIAGLAPKLVLRKKIEGLLSAGRG